MRWCSPQSGAHEYQAHIYIAHTFVLHIYLYHTHTQSLSLSRTEQPHMRLSSRQSSTHLYRTCMRITHTFVSYTHLKYKHTHTLSLALSQTQYHDITERDRECVCTILLHVCLYHTSYRSDRIKMSTISIFVFISEREATACKFKGKKLIPYTCRQNLCFDSQKYSF